MARDIRTTLAVDGEQAYTRAIKEASKSITQMGTQLTLATAEFKKDGDAMKLMESRSKTLRAEIDQQEKIVKSLEGAVKDMTEQYGENSKEVEKWEAELNRAKAKLVNLQTELQNNDQGLDRNGKSFDAAKDKAQCFGEQLTLLQRIQQSTTFQALNTALGKIESGFKSAMAQGKQFAAFVWNTASESSNWADDLATESIKLGISVETLQGWIEASELVDTDLSTLKSAIVKLTNPTDALKESMRALGIHTKDAFAVVEDNGAVDTEIVSKTAVDLMWEAVEALGKESDAVKRNQLANELFGKSYMDMLPLIEAGKESWDAYVKSAEESGRVLDAEAVGKLTTFNDALVVFNSQMEAFKNTIMSEIAPGLTTVTEAGTKFLEQLTKWAQSDEGQAKLTELSGSIAGLVESLATEDNFNAVVEGATGVIKGLTDALNWIIDNHGAVEIGVGAIATAVGAIKVGSGVLSVLTLINQIKWLEVAKGAGALGGATGGTATGGAAAAEGATAGGFLSGIFTKAGAALKTALSNVAPYAALAAVTAEAGNVIDAAAVEHIAEVDAKLEEAAEAATAAGEGVQTLKDALDLLGAGYKGELDDLAGAFKTLDPEMLRQALPDNDLWNWLDQSGGDWGKTIDSLSGPVLADYAEELAIGLVGAINNAVQSAAPEMQAAAPAIEEQARDLYAEMYKVINDYDPLDTWSETPTDFWKNVLEPMVKDTAAMDGVTGESADAIAEMFHEKFLESLFEEEWEGTTDGLLNILQEAIEEAQATAEPDAENAGQAVSDGVASGIDAGIPAAVHAAGRLAAAVNDKLRSVLQIASPSKVTRGLGQYVGIGFAEGIDDAISAVEAATGRMAVAVAGRGYGYAGTGYGGTYSPNYARTMNIQNYYQRSDADIDSLMDAMNQEARYERAGRGA